MLYTYYTTSKSVLSTLGGFGNNFSAGTSTQHRKVYGVYVAGCTSSDITFTYTTPTWIGFLGEDLKLELIVKAAGKPKIRDHHP